MMGEFESKVRSHFPTGDPLGQAHEFLRSEKMDVALQLCRMYLVDKQPWDDAIQARAAILRQESYAREQLEKELTQAQDALKTMMQQAKAAGEESYEARRALEVAQQRILNLQQLLASTNENVDHWHALFVRAAEEGDAMRALLLRCNDVVQPGFGASDDERQEAAQQIRAFLAEHPPVVEEALEDDDDE